MSGICTAADEITTTRAPASRSAGSAACVTSYSPHRFVRCISSQSDGLSTSSARPGIFQPVAYTRMSIPPNASTTASTEARAAAGS